MKKQINILILLCTFFTTYAYATAVVHNGTTYGTVTSPHTGRVWLDRNLGASQVCTSSSDSACYGDYYQWGRNADGHEDIDSSTTSTQTSNIDNVGHDNFITGHSDWASADSDGSQRSVNWSKLDGSSVCPSGFRVPTITELTSETIDVGASGNTDVYNGFLKLPSTGYHSNDGRTIEKGTTSYVWSTNTNDTVKANDLYFTSGLIGVMNNSRGNGFSLRCIQDESVVVNSAPIANQQTIFTNTNVSVNIILTANDSDGDSLSYSVETQPTNGTLSGTAPNLVYTPSSNYSGNDSFTFKVNDGTIDSEVVTVNTSVASVFQSGEMYNGVAYGTVTSPNTGRIWLDRNLGASKVCSSDNDTACYGDYYQWGRNADGHENNSATSGTVATDINNIGHDNFIIGHSDWTSEDSDGSQRAENWSKLDGSSVCPVGYRVPTHIELKAETIDAGLASNYSTYNNFLELAFAGYRNHMSGSELYQSSDVGYIWSTGVDGTYRTGLYLAKVDSKMNIYHNASGLSVRCIQDESVVVNSVPVANPQHITTSKNVSTDITLTGNDIDANTLIYTVVTEPTNGTLTGVIPNLVYTPSSNYSGDDSFTFKVNDGTVDSEIVIININVTDVFNDGDTHNGTTYGTVTSPHTGRIWLDRNLGASQVCTTLSDEACYGDYYQWGRNADGHEDIDSSTTSTQTSNIDNVGHDNFITGHSDWASADSDGSQRSVNWSKLDGSSVCPSGFRVPTITELTSETIDVGASGNTDVYNGFLKLPTAGRRNKYGDITEKGISNFVWASNPSDTKSSDIYFNSSSIRTANNSRAGGYSVRCVQDESVVVNSVPTAESIADIYTDGKDEYVLSQDAGEVSAGDIISKSEDVNGNVCYKVGENIITQAGVIVPTHLNNNLLNYTCTGENMATFSGTGSNRALNVSSLNEFVTNSTVDTEYKIYINSQGIDSTLERCTDSNKIEYSTGQTVWSDNCSDIPNASYAITNGSREDLEAPSSSNKSRINLTVELGNEENYLSTGIKYSSNTDFFQWFYSTTGKITNNMLEGIPCSTSTAFGDGVGQLGCTNAKSVGYGITPNGNSVEFSSIGSSGLSLWHNGTNVLSYNGNNFGNTISSVNTDVVGYVTPAGTNIPIHYTKEMSGTYKLTSDFEISEHTLSSGEKSDEGCNWVNEHMNNTNVCSARGMRLPTWNELDHASPNSTNVTCNGDASPGTGVPAAANGTSYTWSASARPLSGGGKSHFWKWISTTDNAHFNDYELEVRCVVEENAQPIATTQHVTTNENTDVNITLTASDDDNNTLAYEVVINTTNGTLSGTIPKLMYTPNAGYIGSDSFTFKVNDGTVDSKTTTVSINVTGVFKNGDTWNGKIYNTVISPNTGRIWFDRNLGASQVCTALDDEACYGDYYQWGRNADGHEKFSSATTTTQVTDVANATHSNFVTGNSDWAEVDLDGEQRSLNWSTADGNSVCPIGYRVPTLTELTAETIDIGTSNNIDVYNGFLKLASSGRRSKNGVMVEKGISNFVWSSTPSSTQSSNINFNSDSIGTASNGRAGGYSVRCIQGASVVTNQAPTATAQSVTTGKNTAVNITLAATDSDNDSLTYTVVTNPTNGTLSGTAPNLTYTPNTDYDGSDSFTFKVNDGTVDSEIITVSINIDNVIPIVVTHNGTGYGTVTSTTTERVWLDRNLGASRVCTSIDDTECYGDYYQWGRDSDGHEKANSVDQGIPSSKTDNAGSQFINAPFDWTTTDSLGKVRSADWSKTDGSSICPKDYRVPTRSEYEKEIDWQTTGIETTEDIFNTSLKLPPAGQRNYLSAELKDIGSHAYYATTSNRGLHSTYVMDISTYQIFSSFGYSPGVPVRCIKDAGIDNLTPEAIPQSIVTNKNKAVKIILTTKNAGETSLEYEITKNPVNGAITGTAPNLVYTPNSEFKGVDELEFKVKYADKQSPVVEIKIETLDSLVITHDGTAYGTVTSSITENVWLDRNLGASRVCTSFDDTECYGDYYQWGRDFDGHEKFDSSFTGFQPSSIDNVGNKFIKYMIDWTSTDSDKSARHDKWALSDGNSVCPVGFRVPTQDEFKSEVGPDGLQYYNVDTNFDNEFKFAAAGFRRAYYSTMLNQGSHANYWTIDPKSDSNSAYSTDISTYQIFSPFGVASGLPIRCIQDKSVINEAPIAQAGEDQNISKGVSVILDASISSDDKQVVSFSWSENGSVLSTEKIYTTSDFSAGIHIITLTVMDKEGYTDTDDVIIEVVEKQVPIIIAGYKGGPHYINQQEENNVIYTFADDKEIQNIELLKDGIAYPFDKIGNNSISIKLKSKLELFVIKVTDNEGNKSQFEATFVLDTVKPNTVASIKGDLFYEAQTVRLISSEESKIYYSTDGYPPKKGEENTTEIDSSVEINISKSTNLQFYAVDTAGNEEEMKSEIYLIGFPIAESVIWLKKPNYNADAGNVTLSWDISKGFNHEIDEYKVYRVNTLIEKNILQASKDNRFVASKQHLIAENITTNSYTDTNVEKGAKYYYAVSGIYFKGLESSISNIQASNILPQTKAPDIKESISRAKNYLYASQHAKGYWALEDGLEILTTTEVLNAMYDYKDENPASFNTATRYLYSTYADNNNYLSRKIITLAKYGFFVEGLINKFISEGSNPYINSPKIDGWGISRTYKPDPMNTVLACKVIDIKKYDTSHPNDINGNKIENTADNLKDESDFRSLDGYWGWVKLGPKSIYVSSYVYKTIDATEADYQWILDTQNSNGSFIDDVDDESDDVGDILLDTVGVILHLDIDQDKLDKAIQYIISQQDIYGTWHSDPYMTALCLQALKKANK